MFPFGALFPRNPRKLTFLIPDLLGRAAEHRKPINCLAADFLPCANLVVVLFEPLTRRSGK